MNKIDNYFTVLEELHSYFGYVENWRIFPTVDERRSYWYINESANGGGDVNYGDSKEQVLDDNAGDFYSGEIYTQRHLSKWVYESEDGKYTMALVATGCDNNIFFMVLDNEKRVEV